MTDSYIRWGIGLSVAVIGGWLFTWAFYWGLGKYMKLPKKDDSDLDTRGVPSWFTGMTERLFFAIIVGAEIAGAAVAMMVWLTVKMVTNWNRPGPSSASGENLAKQTRFGGSCP